MGKSIMIVDDDPGMQDAFRLIFERAGYQTTVLGSAATLLDGTARLPDILILDKQLSGLDGLDVCRYLKGQAASRHIPIIIISATPHAAHLAKAAFADGFIEKPFRLRSLLDMVASRLVAI